MTRLPPTNSIPTLQRTTSVATAGYIHFTDRDWSQSDGQSTCAAWMTLISGRLRFVCSTARIGKQQLRLKRSTSDLLPIGFREAPEAATHTLLEESSTLLLRVYQKRTFLGQAP